MNVDPRGGLLRRGDARQGLARLRQPALRRAGAGRGVRTAQGDRRPSSAPARPRPSCSRRRARAVCSSPPSPRPTRSCRAPSSRHATTGTTSTTTSCSDRPVQTPGSVVHSSIAPEHPPRPGAPPGRAHRRGPGRAPPRRPPPTSAAPTPVRRGGLRSTGVKVLDLTWAMAGPATTQGDGRLRRHRHPGRVDAPPRRRPHHRAVRQRHARAPTRRACCST